jgi:hypothetical protein
LALLAVGILALAVLKAPANSIVFQFHKPFNNGVTFKNIGPSTIVFFVLNYFLIMLFGFVLAHPFFKKIPSVPFLMKFFSGFFIGFTSVLGLVRLIAFIVPYPHAYWPMMTVIVMVVGRFFITRPFYKAIRVPAISGKTLLKGVQRGGLNCIVLIIGFGFVWTALMLQISQGDFVWVGHGINQYSYLLNEWRGQGLPHFPVVAQHYDELIFHYFLTLPVTEAISPIVPWWMTLAMIKWSLFCFVFVSLRKMDVSIWLSSVVTVFVFWGTSSVLPQHYYLLFDSSNPLFYTVHSGRVIGIGFILFVLGYYLSIHKGEPWNPWGVFLFMLGVTFTSISNGLWVILFLVVLFFSVRVHSTEALTNEDYR